MIRYWAAVALAFSALGRAKGRSLLTVLGILIGVAAVVVVTALGTGVREKVAGEIRSLGSNAIFVWGKWNHPSGARRQLVGGRLTEGDARAILQEATSVSRVVPFLSAQAQVVAGDRNVPTAIVGTSRGYLDVRGYHVARGDMFTEADEKLKSKVCVLGDTVRKGLFGSQDALGQLVRVGRYPFRVVGVLAPKGQSPGGEDQDDRLLVPAGTFRARVLPAPAGRVHMLIVSASSERTVGRAQSQVESILRQRHRIADDQEPDFAINSQADFLKMQAQIFDTLQTLLVGIALVSLGVGGIGVMNIMLVAVRERTREIGIRMAIGAREHDVRFQFLAEAIVLCLLGGLLGIALGVAAIIFMARALGWAMWLPWPAVGLAVATSFAVGLLFGFLPARHASRLEPIEALRHE